MGKISQVAAKYIIHTKIQIEGVVDRPDVIGAIFGQTEGLLGADLELRELQRSGRIGRIEVNTDVKGGKTDGEIILPSSLDKEETVLVAAAMETIQRIGPCNAKVHVDKIEDVRISKRNFVVERAKELLKQLSDEVLPDSAELREEVAQAVKVMEIVEYGRDRIPAGPTVDESEELIVVEGRADVLNLLKNGIKNVVALGGTNVPDTIVELSKKKEMTLFVDGDRGGDLIIKGVMGTCDVDFVIKAPDGKEVEELTKKEIHKALRNKIAAEQAKLEIKDVASKGDMIRQINRTLNSPSPSQGYQQRSMAPRPAMSSAPAPVSRPMTAARPAVAAVAAAPKPAVTKEQKDKFKQLLEDLIGTRGAYILDNSLAVLGKVPLTELISTVRSLKSGMYAVIFDGTITKDIVLLAERAGISAMVAMDSAVKQAETKVTILSAPDLQ
ncbi:MAG TPA: DNA primase [Nanoarchaeota archaeon]|nr:DNA primase [Nanoarchaeota archaeon]